MGLFLLLSVPPAQASLITNGSFESGTTGWTFQPLSGTSNARVAADGARYAQFFGQDSAVPPYGRIYQDIATGTGSGSYVRVDFATDQIGTGNIAQITVEAFDLGDLVNPLASQAINTVGSDGTSVSNWSYHTFTFVPVSGTSRLVFRESSPTTQNIAPLLDNVSAVLVPEPSTTLGMVLLATLTAWRRKRRRPTVGP